MNKLLNRILYSLSNCQFLVFLDQSNLHRHCNNKEIGIKIDRKNREITRKKEVIGQDFFFFFVAQNRRFIGMYRGTYIYQIKPDLRLQLKSEIVNLNNHDKSPVFYFQLEVWLLNTMNYIFITIKTVEFLLVSLLSYLTLMYINSFLYHFYCAFGGLLQIPQKKKKFEK